MQTIIKTVKTFLVLSILSLALSAQVSMPWLSGRVINSETNEPLVGATIKFRIIGSNVVIKGIRTNSDGEYKVQLPVGKLDAEISYIGYKTKHEDVPLFLSLEKDFKLNEGDVTTSEILVDAGEDLVTAVMKRAIRFKKSQRENLKTYEVEAYAKRSLKSDTSIAGITETIVKGYWRLGDTLREVIVQERITENTKAEMREAGQKNLAAGVGRLLDFSLERVRIQGNQLVSPIANDAFEFYKFKLLDVKKVGKVEYYKIKLIPQSKYIPLFEGEIKIAGETYALVGLDVQPAEGGFKLPYLENVVIKYKQTQELQTDSIGHEYWLPASQTLESGFDVSIAEGLIELPRIDFKQTTAIYGYKINEAISDTIFVKPIVMKSTFAEKFDSTFWKEREFISLTKAEEVAFAKLDSTMRMEQQFKPRGAASGLLTTEKAFDLINIPKYRYNRVEGYFLGAQYERDSTLANRTTLKGSLGYGLQRKEWLWTAGFEEILDSSNKWKIGLDAYRTTSFSPEHTSTTDLINTVSTLFYKHDYHNYHNAEGFRAYLNHQLTPFWKVELAYLSEQERSMAKATDYSWFRQRNLFRNNPVIEDGNLRSLSLISEYNVQFPFLRTVLPFMLHAELEHSSKAIGSDFEFTRGWIYGSTRFKTFFRERLLAPYLFLFAEAGSTFGADHIQQRTFSLESAVSGFGIAGTMLAANEKEFTGNHILSFVAEHNFQSVPFEFLKINFLAKRNMQLIARTATARIWQGKNPIQYSEAGFAIGGWLGLFRTDFVWGFRENQPTQFRVALGVGLLF